MKIKEIALLIKKSQLKLFLIIILFLSTIHIIFEKNKIHILETVKDKNVTKIIFSDEQYQAALYSNADEPIKFMQLNSTKIKYLGIFPKESMLIIYLGYFICLSGLIINTKFKKNDTVLNER
jgi:hypothetical protein